MSVSRYLFVLLFATVLSACGGSSVSGSSAPDNSGGNQQVLDSDSDGIRDSADNCPLASNAGQADADLDGFGDACDSDADNDGVLNANDNCPVTANADQADVDGDLIGDACDQGSGDGGAQPVDTDMDGIFDANDNCPSVSNPGQADADEDGEGDVCDNDADNDGICDALDQATLDYGEMPIRFENGSTSSVLPRMTGLVPNSVSITPALPSGLTLNTLTGEL